jgi:FkbM family methyltransferase
MNFREIFRRKAVKELDEFAQISYAQEGEDILLERLFQGVKTGFFVDVGAHHPRRFSNTYLLYLRGWRGINIDPLPGTKLNFDRERPEDINLEMGVSEKEQKLIYYSFNEPALNTFDKKEAERKDGAHNGLFVIEKQMEIDTRPLATILDTYLTAGKEIDLLTIDVEGLDSEVLNSNNWDKYRPKFILVEELRNDVEKIISTSSVYAFLKSKKYNMVCRTRNTSFYRRSE